MKFLIDQSPLKMAALMRSPLVAGQLLTPLTRYKNAGLPYAIDNGAFSGFDKHAFAALLEREKPNRIQCLFVVAPDIVGSAQRTLELWHQRWQWIRGKWKMAFVAQDGAENIEIPWDQIDAIFIGGMDPWKDSRHAQDIVKTAKILDKHVHVGRVNTWKRYKLFAGLGADTCDGSGIARFRHMLPEIERKLKDEDESTNLYG